MHEYASRGQEGKANFDHVYDLPDPRQYFKALVGDLDYRIPAYGQRLFSPLIAEFRGERAKVVDLCCSYGVNAALLKHQFTLDGLYKRYRSPELQGLSSAELAEADRKFYGARIKESSPRVVGLDVAANAVAYAERAGLLDEGFAEDLEENEPTEELRLAVQDAGLITSTGGVGYITERTFRRILDSVELGQPWIASLVLRWIDFGPLAETLSEYGMTTEKLEGYTFPQRKFADEKEQENVCAELEHMGIDPRGKESEGYYHAEFYLSRPSEHNERSVFDLLAPSVAPRGTVEEG